MEKIALERSDPLAALEALSRQLPQRVFVRSLHNAGADWQVDGYAPRAAQVLAVLTATPGFHDVHFLSATNRAQLGAEQYESFAIAFRFIPAP
jgi:Tfp pilus assembly protein PilN